MLQNTWKDKVNTTNGFDGDDIDADDINQIANAVIDLEKKESSLRNVQADWQETNQESDTFIKNKPNLSAVATSGNFIDLNNKPVIDTSFNPKSENSQSGKAVAEAIDLKVDKQTTDGGFEAGEDALAQAGGVAIGNGAIESGGGVAIGKISNASYNGIAIGDGASEEQAGVAIGNNSHSWGGSAIGYGAKTGRGVSIGYNARTQDENEEPIDAIQLGEGNNPNEKTLQIYDYQLMDKNGQVPAERLSEFKLNMNKITDINIETPGIYFIDTELYHGFLIVNRERLEFDGTTPTVWIITQTYFNIDGYRMSRQKYTNKDTWDGWVHEADLLFGTFATKKEIGDIESALDNSIAELPDKTWVESCVNTAIGEALEADY